MNAVHYARIVERKGVLRNLISAAGRIAGLGYQEDGDVGEVIDRAEQELFAVSEKRVSRVRPAQVPPARGVRPPRLPA